MVPYPPLSEVNLHVAATSAALRAAGLSPNTVNSIKTKAFRTGRKVTGVHATNRELRWAVDAGHPQYGTELDCKIIYVKLAAQIFCFDNAPDYPVNLARVSAEIKAIEAEMAQILEQRYLGHPLSPGTYRDSLLLERFDFNDLVQEGLTPIHGHSSFHLGHEDPTQSPKHTPGNISWRTFRSNLIQGNMTLRQSRIYFTKLIARYLNLGEISIDGEANEAAATAAAPTE